MKSRKTLLFFLSLLPFQWLFDQMWKHKLKLMCLVWISTRVSSELFQVEQSFSYLEIQGIQSNKPTQVQTTTLSFLFITLQHT